MTVYEEMAKRASVEQLGRLICACEALSARFLGDAGRIVYQGRKDENLLPWLDNLPIGDVREFDEAICPILEDGIELTADAHQVRAKYEAAMAEMRNG